MKRYSIIFGFLILTIISFLSLDYLIRKDQPTTFTNPHQTKLQKEINKILNIREKDQDNIKIINNDTGELITTIYKVKPSDSSLIRHNTKIKDKHVLKFRSNTFKNIKSVESYGLDLSEFTKDNKQKLYPPKATIQNDTITIEIQKDKTSIWNAMDMEEMIQTLYVTTK